MSYYKTPDDSLHYLDSPKYEYLLPAGSVPITDEQAEAMKPKPSASEVRINELKSLLASTDYKVLPDYDRTDEATIAQRQAWRDEIRSLLDEQDNEAT
jgi:hypothetical protein